MTTGEGVMDRNIFKRLRCLGIVLVGAVSLALIVNSYSYAQGSKISKGLNFQVPEDWPVEKRGGIVAPIPIEEYLEIKFTAVEEKFEAIKDELSGKFLELQSDLEGVEKDFSKKIKGVQSEGESQGEVSGDSTEILSSVKSLESELGRLDRKITNKVREMQVQFEKMNQQMMSVEKEIKDLQTQVYKLDEKVDYIDEKSQASY